MLAPWFLGRHSVVHQNNPICYKFHLPPSLNISNAFQVSLLKPLILYHLSHKPVSLSLVSGPEDVFRIKEILEAKPSRAKLCYVIDWILVVKKSPGNQLRILMPLNSSASFIAAKP